MALLDIFEVDANTFATVLQLCTGGDLDTHLKEHGVRGLQQGAVVKTQQGARGKGLLCWFGMHGFVS